MLKQQKIEIFTQYDGYGEFEQNEWLQEQNQNGWFEKQITSSYVPGEKREIAIILLLEKEI